MVNGVNQVLNKDYAGAAKSGIDVVMGFVGMAGPIGFAVSRIYFIVEQTVGWDKAIETSDKNIKENKKIVPNWSPRPTGGL